MVALGKGDVSYEHDTSVHVIPANRFRLSNSPKSNSYGAYIPPNQIDTELTPRPKWSSALDLFLLPRTRPVST